jgi:hypothetical protein
VCLCKIHTSIFEFDGLFTSLYPLFLIYKSILNMRVSPLSEDNLNLLWCAHLLNNHLSQNVVYRFDPTYSHLKDFLYYIKSIFNENIVS